MPLVRSISGVRGIVGEALTPEVVVDYVRAFAVWLSQPATVAVGRDGRQGGEWIEAVVIGVLRAAGYSVAKLGVVPTPTVQLFVEHSADVAGGIVITASHNPAQWNGLKFLNADGVFLSKRENQQLWQLLEQHTAAYAAWDRIGAERSVDDAATRHIEAVLKMPYVAPWIDRIRQQQYTVVVDAVNAAGSGVVPALLEQLGCQVIPLYCAGNGVFPRTPEPLPQHLGELQKAVAVSGANLGIAVDPDADRLVLVTEQGMPVWEEYTITLAAKAVMELGVKMEAYAPVVVVNLSTTRAVDDVAAHYGWKVARAPVGEINVVERMKQLRAAIGGEGSGGVIVPDCHYGRDSLVGIALVMTLLTVTQQSLSEIVQQLPRYVMRKIKVPAQSTFTPIAERLQTAFPDAIPTLQDGVKLDWEDRWVHVRPSNTEPIWRIIVEAPTEEAAETLLQQVQLVMQG